MHHAVQSYRRARNRLIILDYDGTLVGFQPDPDAARPDARVLEILRQLGEQPGNTVAVLSGRDRHTLDAWLGHLPLVLIAEHGCFIKDAVQGWRATIPLSDTWKQRVRPAVKKSVAAVPGSFVEEKSTALVWHYRAADQHTAGQEIPRLLQRLVPLVSQYELAVVPGNKIIEVRPSGMDKGAAARTLLAGTSPDFILAAGDDTTDEDLFATLPPNAYSIKVGRGRTKARQRCASPGKLLDLLSDLLAEDAA